MHAMADNYTLSDLVDRLAIEDLLIRYCTAIDNHDWELMDTVFVPDGIWDSTAVGGSAGTYRETRARQAEDVAPFVMFHQLSNICVDIAGDQAVAKSYVTAPIGTRGEGGTTVLFTVGAWYHDKLVRTEAGWRIAERVEEARWHSPTPPTAE